MNLIDHEVTHIKFGAGRVVNKDDERVMVVFTDTIGQKTFVYPDVFEQYLRMNNPVIQDFVFSEYKRKQEQLEAEKQHREKLLREETERAASILAERQAIDKKAKPSKKKAVTKKK